MNRWKITAGYLAGLLPLLAMARLLTACGSPSSAAPQAPGADAAAPPGSSPSAVGAPADGGLADEASSGAQGAAIGDSGGAQDGSAVATHAAGGALTGAEGGPVAARPSAGCADAGAPASTGSVNLAFESTARSYLLHLPATATKGPIPLVINLHMYGGSGAVQESLTGMDTVADSEGFIVTYPNGLGDPTDWNAGSCCSAASEGNRDDVGFIAAVVDDVAAHACVDLARVYVAGFSNGGMMTVRLACQMADTFAAAATVSGTAAIPLDTCQPSRPIAFLHVHGNADPLVPYDGGSGGLAISGEPTPVFPAVAQEIATMRGEDNCPAASDVYFDQGNASCTQFSPCGSESEVIFCTISGGGHAWPTSGTPTSEYAEMSAFDATTQIWRFFNRHAL